MARFATAIYISLVCFVIADITEAKPDVKCGPNEVYQICSRYCEECNGGGCYDVCIDTNSRFGCYCKKGYCREGFGPCHSCIAGTLTAQGAEQSTSVNVCLLDSDSGGCYGNFPRYFFNRRTGRCELFTYGGCDGNGNNFETEQECYDRCGPRCPNKEEYKVCSALCDKDCRCNGNCNQPSQVPGCYCKRGFCRSRYGACTRTFPTNEVAAQAYPMCLEENNVWQKCSRWCENCDKGGGCRPSCIDTEEEYGCYCFTGYCRSSKTNRCVRKTTTALSADDDSDEQGPNTNVWFMDPDPGPCIAKIERYFYNWRTGRCEIFFYGGCGGNRNNFRTEQECYTTCGPQCPTNEEYKVCSALCDRDCRCNGNCNHATQVPGCYCKRGFCRNQYGACTRIYTSNEVAAEAETGGSAINLCLYPPDPGTGNNLQIRFFFSYDTEKCHRFFYKGYGGNNNNFRTELECHQKCGPPCKKENEEYSVCSPDCDRHCQCHNSRCKDTVQSTACYCKEGYCRYLNGECVALTSNALAAPDPIDPCCFEDGTNYQRCSRWCESCEKGGGCHPFCLDTNATKGCYCLEGLCRSSVTNKCVPRQSSSVQATIPEQGCNENQEYKLGHHDCEACYAHGCDDICYHSDAFWGCWCKKKYCRDAYFATTPGSCRPCNKPPEGAELSSSEVEVLDQGCPLNEQKCNSYCLEIGAYGGRCIGPLKLNCGCLFLEDTESNSDVAIFGCPQDDQECIRFCIENGFDWGVCFGPKGQRCLCVNRTD